MSSPKLSLRLASLMAASLASQALIVVFAPAMVMVSREFGVGVDAVSQARSAVAIGAVLASLGMGWVLRRLGMSLSILAGGALAIASCIAIASAQSLWTFLAAHLLAGGAVALLLSSSFAGAAACGDDTPKALGLVAGANSLAWVLVNPLSGVLTQSVSWRAAYFLPAAAATAAICLCKYAPTAVPRTRLPGDRQRLIKVPAARNWLLAEIASYCAWTAILTFVGPLLIERERVPESFAGVALGVGAGAFFIVSTRSTKVVRGRSLRHLSLIAAVSVAVLGAFLFLVPLSPWLTTAVFFALTACAGVRTPVATLLGVRAVPDQATALMAARTAVTQLGYLGGAAIGGLLFAWNGFGAIALLVVSGMIVAGYLLYTRVADPGDRLVMAAAAPAGH